MECSIEMYGIRKENIKIKIPCERCLEKGIVDNYCEKCGGNGTHLKTIQLWKVRPNTITVKRIDRSSKDNFYRNIQTSYEGELRYWTGESEFYNEREKYLHFTKSDAQKECNKRNKYFFDILNKLNRNPISFS